MNIILPGQYPRSEQLVAQTRHYDRGRISLEELERARINDTHTFCELQRSLPYVSTGLFSWQDLMRPFTEILEGASAGVLTRFFETNSFWRKLTIDGPLKLNDSILDQWIERYFFSEGIFAKDESMVMTLPFIYLFREFSTGISLEEITDLLEQIATALMRFPNKLLCFFEPTFGWRNLSDEEKNAGRRLIEKLKMSSETPIFLYNAFFSIQADHRFIFDLPLDGIGIDFYANSVATMIQDFPSDKCLLAGILSTNSTHIETREQIEGFIKLLNGKISKQKLFFTTSGPAELLPRSVMDAKLNVLKEILA